MAVLLVPPPTHQHPPTPGSPSPTYHVLEQPGSRVRIFGQVALALHGEDTASVPEGRHPTTLPASPPQPPGCCSKADGCKRCARAMVTRRRKEPTGCWYPLPPVPGGVPGPRTPARRGPSASGRRWCQSPAPAARLPPAAGSACTPLPSPAGQHRQGHIGIPPKYNRAPPMPAFAELGFKCQSQAGTAFCSLPCILQYPSPKLVAPLIDAISAVR